MERSIIIAGSGGQGILFLGRLLACAAMSENREVTWFPSYGAEIRGGTANCTVIISDEMIGSPVVKNSDCLIVLNDASFDKYFDRLVTGGTLIYDSSLIHSKVLRDDICAVPVPASEIAAASDNAGAANMALIGSFASVSGLIRLGSLFSALEDITPARRRNFLDINKKIIEKGYALAEDTKSSYSRHKANS